MTTLHSLRQRLTAHPAITAIAAVDLVLVVVEMAANHPPDALSWLLFAVQFAASALIAVMPTPACAVSLVLCAVAALLPGSPSFCTSLAFPTLGLLAYLAVPAWACLAAIALSLTPSGTGVSMSFGGSGGDVRMTGFAVNVVCYLIAVGVGVSLRRRADARRERDRRAEYERAQRELAQVRRNQHLAKALHDSVTRELSSMSMLAWQWQQDDQADPTVREVMGAMYRDSRSALDHVHEVIDLIGGGDGAIEDESSSATTDCMDALRRLIDAEQRSMIVLGFTGESMVHGETLPLNRQAREVMFDLVREIYANIIRHAMPGADEYMVAIAVRDGRLAITQTNTVQMQTTDSAESPGTTGASTSTGTVTAQQPNGSTSENPPARTKSAARHPLSDVRHGLGLDVHRKAVERLGGVMRTRLEDGEWFLHVELPLAE